MGQLAITNKWRSLLATLLPHDQDLTETELDQLLAGHLPKLGVNLRKRVKEALAIAAYRTQTAYRVVDLFLCDDAPPFNALTAWLALCWIHAFRHSKKLLPRFVHHCQLLQDFGKAFWKLYQGLLDYREHPIPTQAAALEAEFDQLFTYKSGYDQLDECKARTLAKKEALLMVLSHPEILFHTNPAELGARQRVRKRLVSLQARTREGIEAWDTFQTLVATAKKLGVNLFHYLQDRIRSPVLSYSHPPTGPTDGLRGIVATRALNLLQECELNIPSSSDPRWSPFVGLPPAKPLACSHPLPYPTFLG